MSERVSAFENLLERCKLRAPVPEDLRGHAIRGRENINDILKKSGSYGIILGIIFKLFLIFRDLGIRASFLQIKILLAVAAAGVTVSVPVGGYYALKYISVESTEIMNEDAEQGISEIQPLQGLEKKVSEQKALPPAGKYEIGISDFTGNADIRGLVGDRIGNRLISVIGKKRITPLDYSYRDRVSKIITGTVQRFGDKYLITAKIIDVETSRVIDVVSDKADRDNIDLVCDAIIDKLSDKLK